MTNHEEDVRDILKELAEELKEVKIRMGRIEASKAQGSHVQPPYRREPIDVEYIRRTSNRTDDEESIGDYGREHESLRRTHDDVEKGIRFDLPDFEINLDSESFLEWIQTVESIFDYKKIDDERRCRIAVLKLKFTRDWYENLKRRREREGKSRIRSWDKLKKHLKKNFVPREYEQEKFISMTTLRQELLGVEEYI